MYGFDIPLPLFVDSLETAMYYTEKGKKPRLGTVLVKYYERALYFYASNAYEIFVRVCPNIRGRLPKRGIHLNKIQCESFIQKFRGNKDTIRLMLKMKHEPEKGQPDDSIGCGQYKLLGTGGLPGLFQYYDRIGNFSDFPSIILKNFEPIALPEICDITKTEVKVAEFSKSSIIRAMQAFDTNESDMNLHMSFVAGKSDMKEKYKRSFKDLIGLCLKGERGEWYQEIIIANCTPEESLVDAFYFNKEVERDEKSLRA